MKLIDSFGPNPRVVRMFLAEKGLTLPSEEVDLLGGQNRQDGYLSRNPGGQLPALELDNGTVIAETAVICEYIEELHPTPVLIGRTSEERAHARTWQRFRFTGFLRGQHDVVDRRLFGTELAVNRKRARNIRRVIVIFTTRVDQY